MNKYCLVLRDVSGQYYRTSVDDLPSEEVIKYYENHHKSYYGVDAVVVNVYEIS